MSGASALVMAASFAFHLLWIAPEKGKITNLTAKVQSLRNEKKALMELMAREGWHSHGDGHYHKDVEGAEEENSSPLPSPLKGEGKDKAGSMARKILEAEKPLGLKAFQLKVLEEMAGTAARSRIQTLSYQKLMEDPEKVTTIDRQPEEGVSFKEDIFRYRFRIDLESDYAGVAAFIRDLERTPLPVAVQGIRLGRGSEGRIKVQLDLAAYYRQRI